MSVHVYPVNRDHRIDDDAECWCHPDVEYIDPDTGVPWAGNGPLVIHSNAGKPPVAKWGVWVEKIDGGA